MVIFFKKFDKNKVELYNFRMHVSRFLSSAFKSLAGKDAAETGLLVCRVKKSTPLPSNNLALPWQEFPSWLVEKL